MTTDSSEIKNTIKDYILKEFLPGESAEALTDTTELITHGVLDSLSTLALDTFIESEYSIRIAAHEVSTDNLNTLSDIENLISSKIPV
jgi:acyl carrier protein